MCELLSAEVMFVKESLRAESPDLFVRFKFVPQVLSTQLQARC